MGLFVLLLLLIAPNVIPNVIILQYRIFVFGFPINLFDLLLAVGVVVTLLPTGGRFTASRFHPLFAWTFVTLCGAAAAGASMAVLGGRDALYFVTATRDFLTLPVAVYLGYRLLTTPTGNLIVTYVQIVSSLFSAVLSVIFIHSTSLMLSETGDNTFDSLRVTTADTAGDSGSIMTYLLMFAIVSRLRVLPRVIELGLIALGLGASFLLPHRSAWVAIAASIIFSVGILPREPIKRRIKALAVIVVASILVAVVAVGIVSRTSERDFGEYISIRLRSLLPGEQEGVKAHAWDTRLPGAFREIELWMGSPIFGRGFGIQEVDSFQHQGIGYRHNTWTSMMAETGVIGLAAALLVTLGTIAMGRRLVRDRLDLGSTLLGAMCAVVGAGFFISGFLSMTFNKQRPALVLGLCCGMAIRCRAMQLAVKEQWAGYLDPQAADAEALAY